MFGNRGIYHKGWTAVTKHRTPWATGTDAVVPPFDDDIWELYDTTTDWTQAHDLAKEHPDKLHELQRLWLIEAVKYDVVPLDDRFAERANPELAGRPDLITAKRQRIHPGIGRLTEWAVLNTKNKSYSVTAEVEVAEQGAEGVLVAMGGITGGMALYAKGGRPTFCYNFFGLEHTVIQGSAAIPAGRHQVRMEFAYDGGGIAKGGDVTLFLDGAPIGEGRLERTHPFAFSGDESVDLGDELGSLVTSDYPAQRKFTGTVQWVELEAGLDDQSHLIPPEDRLAHAMARQ
jgi:arylsulfatase